MNQNRRDFLTHVSTLAATCSLSSIATAAAPATRIIDTHTHFYDPTRKAGVPWPGKGTSLYRPVYPKDWLAVAEPHGVKETVVVEASAWLEDNQWILDLATRERSIVGFVGNLSPHDAECPQHIQRFAANPIFRGIRPSGESFKHFDSAEFQTSIKRLVDAGLSLDINAAKGYEFAAKLAKEFPSLRIVINHVGSAGDAAKLTDAWRTGMKNLSPWKNVFCKISALTEQTEESNKKQGSAPRNTAYYKPILEHCWETFGPQRLMYGSNWPVCEKGGSYADQFKIVSEYFGDKGNAASELFFWKNSRTAYCWVQR